jgi:hypothetical protein
MNRPTAIARQRQTQAPPPPQQQTRGPVSSISSAQLFAQNANQQQQQQQSRGQQQQSRGQQQGPPQIPEQVTIQQAVSVIIARLHALETKAAGSTLIKDNTLPNQEDVNLDMMFEQIFELLVSLEKFQESNQELEIKVAKLENDIRDSKDVIMRLQSFTMDTNKQLASMLLLNKPSQRDESLSTPSLKEIIQNELNTTETD